VSGRRGGAAFTIAAFTIAAFAIAASCVGRSARADTQISAGLTGGYAQHDLRDGGGSAGHLGLRADVLWLREKNTHGALGPYVEGLTVAFSDVQLGGGLSALVPGMSSLAVVGSAGAFARSSELGWRPGTSATLFFGLRPFNFHARYGMANGLFVQGRMGLGATRQADLLFGAQLDLEILSLPFLLLWGALR
jgi:hypothetical protein